MKYVLGIGYDCKKYKQDPRCRVFVNNQLIDEFYIVTPKNKGVNKWKKYKSHQTYIPYLWKKIHFYHIDENVFTKEINNIKIELHNTDSNYTNGFMTKSTRCLINPFLCPAEFITRKGIEKIHNLQKRRILNSLNRFGPRGLNPMFTTRKTALDKEFRNKDVESAILEPTPSGVVGNRQVAISDYNWPSKPPYTWNGKMMPYGGLGFRFLGGSGTLEYKVVKKLGIWQFSHPTIRPIGFPILDKLWARTIAQLVKYDWYNPGDMESLQYYTKGDSNKYIKLLTKLIKDESWISDTGEEIGQNRNENC